MAWPVSNKPSLDLKIEEIKIIVIKYLCKEVY